MTYSTFIGVDPGLSGAVCILNRDGLLITVFDMPVLEKGGYVRRRVDPWRLQELILPMGKMLCEPLAAIESVGYRKGDGGATGASLAHSMGIVEGVVAGLGVSRVLRPLPQVWKEAMGILRGGKERAMRRAKELWPNVNFARHDQAEAALLARFAWLQKDVAR
jgi:hypothetical protein